MPSFGAEYNTILANLAALYDLRQEKIEVVKINRRIDQVGSLIRHPLVQDSTGVIHSLNTATGTYVPVSVLPLAELPDVAHYQNGAIVSVGGVLYVKKNGAWSGGNRRSLARVYFDGDAVPVVTMLDGMPITISAYDSINGRYFVNPDTGTWGTNNVSKCKRTISILPDENGPFNAFYVDTIDVAFLNNDESVFLRAVNDQGDFYKIINTTIDVEIEYL